MRYITKKKTKNKKKITKIVKMVMYIIYSYALSCVYIHIRNINLNRCNV